MSENETVVPQPESGGVQNKVNHAATGIATVGAFVAGSVHAIKSVTGKRTIGNRAMHGAIAGMSALGARSLALKYKSEHDQLKAERALQEQYNG